MKKLIQYIHMEILWYASVFGIDHWKIFNLKWTEVKNTVVSFIKYLSISWVITCAIIFGIHTTLENPSDANFWWTTGMFSAMVYIIAKGTSSDKKINN